MIKYRNQSTAISLVVSPIRTLSHVLSILDVLTIISLVGGFGSRLQLTGRSHTSRHFGSKHHSHTLSSFWVTYSLHCSSFLGLPFRILLNIGLAKPKKKELQWRL